MAETLFVFQGGGPTAVINATLAGVLAKAGGRFSKILGLKHSLEIVNRPELIDLTDLTSPRQLDRRELLAQTPGAILGSSRERVTETHLAGLLQALQTQGARHVLGIGGNGTMNALNQLSEFANSQAVELRIVGAPKTVDNDLPGVAFAPGYGSAARFVALAVRDFDCDFRSMQTFDDVVILETMGRNTGWLAASSVLLKESEADAPHIVLLPERPVDEGKLLQRVSEIHRDLGRVFIVTNEMLKNPGGAILGGAAQNGPTDSLGRTMFSLSTGTGNYLAGLIWKKLGLQARCLRPGSLGRALSCYVSEIDRDLAWRTGKGAVDLFDHTIDEALMLTVSQRLKLGSQPTRSGVGRTPVPDTLLPPDNMFAIGPAFSEFARGIIGMIKPVMTKIGA